MDAVPQQLDGALVAVGREHAGAPELEELHVLVAGDEAGDVEFAGGVEAAKVLCQRLTQQTIGADDRRPAGLALARVVVDHQQVVADRVIGVDVAAGKHPARIGDGRTFLIEDAIAQLLRLPYLGGGLRQPYLQRTHPAEALRRPQRPRGPGLNPAIGLQ